MVKNLLSEDMQEVPAKSKQPSTLEVLVVEDNAILQRVAFQKLSKAGIKESNITIAENGQAAVAIVSTRSQAFDLIYMDEMMPILSGPEATLKIREHEKSNKSFSIIFACSASYDGIYPGANTKLDKPLEDSALKYLIDSVVNQPELFWEVDGAPRKVYLDPPKPDKLSINQRYFSNKFKNTTDSCDPEHTNIIGNWGV